MTLEELVDLAKSGDVQAMIDLGEHCVACYFNDEEVDKLKCLEMSHTFFEMAALKGNVRAMDGLCSTVAIEAYLEREVSGINSKDTLIKYKYLYEWRLREVVAFNKQAAEYESVDEAKLLQGLKDAQYDYAMVCYFSKQWQEAYRVVRTMNEEHRALIIEALIECSQTWEAFQPTEENFATLKAAVDKLILAVTDDVYLSESKYGWEEVMLAHATSHAALAARAILEDVDLAAAILQLCRIHIKDEKAMNLIVEQCSHYTKNILGKYVYTE